MLDIIIHLIAELVSDRQERSRQQQSGPSQEEVRRRRELLRRRQQEASGADPQVEQSTIPASQIPAPSQHWALSLDDPPQPVSAGSTDPVGSSTDKPPVGLGPPVAERPAPHTEPATGMAQLLRRSLREKAGLRQAVLMREILDRPLALRGRRGAPDVLKRR